MDIRNLLPDGAEPQHALQRDKLQVSYIGLLEQVSHLTRGFSFSISKREWCWCTKCCRPVNGGIKRLYKQELFEHNQHRKKCNKH